MRFGPNVLQRLLSIARKRKVAAVDAAPDLHNALRFLGQKIGRDSRARDRLECCEKGKLERTSPEFRSAQGEVRYQSVMLDGAVGQLVATLIEREDQLEQRIIKAINDRARRQ